jgi:ABC-type transport system substrate-binding protein
MKKVLFLLCATVLVVGILSIGCTSNTSTTTTKTTTTTTTTTQTGTTTATGAKPQGTFNFGYTTVGSGTFAPWLGGNFADGIYYAGIYEAMGMPDVNGHAMPCLAESWEFSSDFKSVTFHLRHGIQWDEGWGELTSADVQWSWQQMGSPTSKFGAITTWRQFVQKVDAPDPYTVVVSADVPLADVMWMLTEQEFTFAVILNKAYSENNIATEEKHPIGTGPFHLVEWKSGDHVTLEAKDTHWRCVPEFKTVTIYQVSEETTRVAEMKTGQLDSCQISAFNVPQFSTLDFNVDAKDFVINTMLWFGNFISTDDSRYVAGYSDTDPWMDARVRKAMNLAIDRQALNKTFEGNLAKYCMLWGMVPGWETYAPYPYDVTTAKQLMIDAGYAKGFDCKIVAPGTSASAQEAQAITGYWSEIGINATIDQTDIMTFFNNLMAPGKTKGLLWTYRLVFAANPWQLASDFYPNKLFTPQLPNDPGVRAMADAILAEQDQTKRLALWKPLADYEYNTYTVIGLFAPPTIYINNKKIVGDWARSTNEYYFNWEYIRHIPPLNTFRLLSLSPTGK